MFSTIQATNSPATFAGIHGENIQASAVSAQLAREEAEERRWNLEWDRRNVED